MSSSSAISSSTTALSSSASTVPTGTVINQFTLQESRRNPGQRYYFHSVTNKSYWYDNTLPYGWAWGKINETSPKFYINLYTLQQQEYVPTTPAGPPMTNTLSRTNTTEEDTASTDDYNDRKRIRIDNNTTTIGGGEITTTSSSTTPSNPQSTRTTSSTSGSFSSSTFPSAPAASNTTNNNHTHTSVSSSSSSLSTTNSASTTTSSTESIMSSVPITTATVVKLPGTIIPGRRPPSFPSPALLESECRFGFPATKPANLLPFFHTQYFLPSHALVLRQLVKKAYQQFAEARNHSKQRLLGRGLSLEEAEEESSRLQFKLVDVGCGTGTSVQFLLDQAKEADIFAIDLWDIGRSYYANQLRLYGHDKDAEEWENNKPITSLYGQFAVNFWDNERVFPGIFPSAYGLHKLAYTDNVPWLVWLDADLQYPHVFATLDMLWRIGWLDPNGDLVTLRKRMNNVIVGGGGWNTSEGVRRAVLDFATEHSLSLHIEQGQAWTFSREFITETQNDLQNPLHNILPSGDPTQIAALRVRETEAQRNAARTFWLAEVFQIIDNNKSVTDLRNIIGNHGNNPNPNPNPNPKTESIISGTPKTETGNGTTVLSIASTPTTENTNSSSSATVSILDTIINDLPPPKEGAWSHENWINEGGEDKRHLNPLMRAARANRLDIVQVLLNEYGADVNATADRSNYTALILAAYEGHDQMVQLLLQHGADPSICNKFGETALQSATKGRKWKVIATLQDYIQKNESQKI